MTLDACFDAGGALQDAVGVCAHELGDPQLALFLARLLEGEQGPLQQALLTKELLPGCVLDQFVTLFDASPARALPFRLHLYVSLWKVLAFSGHLWRVFFCFRL